jgi:alkanesulfonate monooxygenase SsuD/methylene tetrahydromethanopterin reductase-like flavin-dependent oxidoreductase (luciferase family)
MTLPVRLGVCILPTSRWADARATWIDMDVAGVDHLWTYDHLSWRDMRDGPWFASMPLLTAVAMETQRALIGPLVASPNFRHPVGFAKECMTLADIADGRFICAVGAGGTGWDSTVLGGQEWSRAERTARFEEFVDTLAALFNHESTTRRGTYYSADEARMIPSITVPIGVAATGPRGLLLAARHADWWITFGDAFRVAELSPDDCLASVTQQVQQLESSCASTGRDPREVRRVLLVGASQEPWFSSVDSFVDLAHRYAAIGITDIVMHAPQKVTIYHHDPVVFERILAANY